MSPLSFLTMAMKVLEYCLILYQAGASAPQGGIQQAAGAMAQGGADKEGNYLTLGPVGSIYGQS